MRSTRHLRPLRPPRRLQQADQGGMEDYLTLEQLAAEPYARFVYDHPDDARAAHRLLLARGLGEFSPLQAEVLVIEDDEGRVVAAAAWLPGRDLTTSRLQAAVAVAKVADLADDPGRQERRRLASATLLTPGPDDLYLSRLAVAEPVRGRGLARQLLTAYEADARRRGFRRLVLDVSSDHHPARRLYAQAGLVETDVRRVRDPGTGRELCHYHLAKPLG